MCLFNFFLVSILVKIYENANEFNMKPIKTGNIVHVDIRKQWIYLFISSELVKTYENVNDFNVEPMKMGEIYRTDIRATQLSQRQW